MKIVEVNCCGNPITSLGDIQARVIECNSWEEYVDYYKNYSGEAVGDYTSIDGGLSGFVLPKGAELRRLSYDDHKLCCEVCKYDDINTQKIACIVR